MPQMKTIQKILFAGVLLVSLTACSAPTAVKVEPLPGAVLTPWQTATIPPSATPTREDLPTATFAPTVTPTPSEYSVKANDTLIVIAYRNGLTVDELLAANPDVNPYVLSIGTVLKIPAPKANAGIALAPTTTPAPVFLGSPECTPGLTGGFHCFVTALNEGEAPLENVLVEFRLMAKDGTLAASRSALLPLAVLQSNETLPIYGYFEPPIPLESKVEVQLLSAYRVAVADSNTFRLETGDPKVEIAQNGMSARVAGTAASATTSPAGKGIHIVVIAYDNAGKVVGIRQYQETAEFTSGAELKYNLIVYSTGEMISSVQVFAEAFE